MKDLKYQIYGSKSSRDLDIMVITQDKLGTINENKIIIEKYKEYFQSIYTDVKCDVHLARIYNGQIFDVSHGTYDEVNNSLYYTYDNFDQRFENSITRHYDRFQVEYVNHKNIRVARFILSFFSREPELRTKIKSALRGDLKERLEVLKLIDFTKYTEFPHKKEKKEDIYKVCAFQFAQTLSLFTGIEIYTKEEAIKYFDIFSPFISREENISDKLYVLNNALELFISLTEKRIELSKFDSLYETL